MKKLTIALAQIPVVEDIAANFRAVSEGIRFAKENGADILLTPEGSLSGYTHQFDSKRLDDALRETEQLAKRSGVGLALGTCKREADGFCYNELRFYLPDGRYLGCHTKTLLCGTMTDTPQGEINHYRTAPLQVFDFMGVTVGGLICNDMWANPGCTPQPDTHLSHRLAAMGARVIFHAVNGGRNKSRISQVVTKQYHEANILLKAAADRIYIATVDNSDPARIPVSSIGGIAAPDADWAFRLQDQGTQFGVFTIGNL